MTLNNLYNKYLSILKEKDIPEIELRMLLCDNNKIISMSDYYLRKNEDICDLQRFLSDITRLLDGEPVQYIINKASFYHREFYVNNDCLIPRMETEEVAQFSIDKIRNLNNKNLNIIDVCTGSGCLAITISKECMIHVDACDISSKTLKVAERNAKSLNSDVKCFKSDLLEECLKSNKRYDVFIANPPYILNRDEIDPRVIKYEPHLSLFPDGESVISLYTRLLKQIKLLANDHAIVVLEIGYDLVSSLTAIVTEIFPNNDFSFIKDINKKYRILYIKVRL